jgi:hypothetical protein
LGVDMVVVVVDYVGIGIGSWCLFGMEEEVVALMGATITANWEGVDGGEVCRGVRSCLGVGKRNVRG